MFWKKKKPKKTTREDITTNAKKAAHQKREEIGDETLDAIRAAILKRQNDPMAKAQKQIKGTDMEKVVDNLSVWMKDKE